MNLSKTDWGLLECCSKNRETRSNLSALLDVTPNYVSSELSKLTEIGLVEQVGPADRSGMYITTAKGDFAYNKKQKYEKQHSELFIELVKSCISIANRLNKNTNEQNLDSNDIVITSTDSYNELHKLSGIQLITPNNAKEVSQYDNSYAVYGILYELYFHDLIKRDNNKKKYQITEKGRSLIDKPVPTTVTVDNINLVWNSLTDE